MKAALYAIMAVVLAAAALALPPSFNQFYGSVKYSDGTNVADGTAVTGRISGTNYTTTSSGGQYGYSPIFVVQGQQGTLIEFFISGTKQSEQAFEENSLTKLDFTLPCPSCAGGVVSGVSGGGGGGGGGGTALVSESSLLQKVLSIGDAGTFTFKKFADIAVYEIAAESAGAATNPSLTVTETNLAAGVALPISKEAGKVYKYLSITRSNFEKVGKATIRFSVPSEWFSNNSLDPSTTMLSRLVSNDWVKLPTKQVRTVSKYTNFEATSEGLSIFAITAEKAKAAAAPAAKPAKTPTGAVAQEEPTQQPVVEAPEQQEQAAPAKKEGGLGFAPKALITVILVIAGALALLEVLHKLHKI